MCDRLAQLRIVKATLSRATKVRNDNSPSRKTKLYLLCIDREYIAANFLGELSFMENDTG